MANKADYYDTLGISKGAGEDEIKKAYRNMAKKYHPDANQGDESAEKKFKEVSEAYDVLSDAKKRETYDRFGHAAFDQSAGGGAGGFYGGGMNFDMSDIFETVFGGDIFGSGRRRSGPRRGADLQTSLKITFEESFFGVEKEIQVSANETCETCKGTGSKPGSAAESCKQCGGSGQERVHQQTLFGTMASVRTCSLCKGEGKIIRNPCQTCKGTAKVRKNKKLQVAVPKGIESGQSIRLSGRGEPGEKGGPSGDLLVTIYVSPHNVFKRNGDDLYLEVPVTFVQAALGYDITIPTMADPERHTIKAGTQTGTVVTIKGKGMPNVRNPKSSGNIVATLKVSVPTNLNEKQKQLLKEFAEEMGEDYQDHKRGFFDKLKIKK
ncbi:MAG: molecular chaperone DnaJ [Defluviitaleaceae bacterium]|nr:molecular chaperone DnaJ [Defluviitaleaceae bacterium]